MLKGIALGVFDEKVGPKVYKHYPEMFLSESEIENAVVNGFVDTSEKKVNVKLEKDGAILSVRGVLRGKHTNLKDYFVLVCVFNHKKQFVANQVPITNLIKKQILEEPIDLKSINLVDVHSSITELLKKSGLLGGLF